MNNQVLKLYENCIITVGKNRSIIIDTQRRSYYLVPNSLVNIFDERHIFDTSKIEDSTENIAIVEEYVSFLIENELCFYCDATLVDNFPKMEIDTWDYPATITNAIVEIGQEGLMPLAESLLVLTNELLTRHIEFFFATTVDSIYLAQVLKMFDQLDLYSYNIIFNLSDNAELEETLRLLSRHHKIHRSIIFNTPFNKIISNDENGWGNIFLIDNAFSYTQCGVVDLNYMSIKLEHISESLNHNTCLNRKIFIGANGEVRSCPNTAVVGTIHSKSLPEIIKEPDFQQYWHIKKNDISICRDCEFRHICTDCRAFIIDPEDIYSKPLKCGYDPYTCEWEEWSINPLKQQAMHYYKINTN